MDTIYPECFVIITHTHPLNYNIENCLHMDILPAFQRKMLDFLLMCFLFVFYEMVYVFVVLINV